jgi:hypothetical protein
MTPERGRQIEDLYHAARENRVVLDHADADLRREVESRSPKIRRSPAC